MFRITLLCALFFLVSCGKDDSGSNCPEGYNGQDCTEFSVPKSIRITGITYSNIPQKDSQGNNWDATNPKPDIYMAVETLGGSVIFASPVSQNYDATQIQYTLDKTVSEPVRVSLIEWSDNNILREMASFVFLLPHFNVSSSFYEENLGTKGSIRVTASSIF